MRIVGAATRISGPPGRIGRLLACLLATGALAAPAVLVGTSRADAASGTGWLRVGDFSPSASAVAVYIDGHVTDSSLAYQGVTPYLLLGAGIHRIALLPAGAPASAVPLATVNTAVPAGGALTLAAIVDGSATVLSAIPDNLAAPPAGDARVRIVGLDHAASGITAKLVGEKGTPGTLSFGPIQYGAASAYQPASAGTYGLTVVSASGTPLVSGVNWPVSAGSVASIVVATKGDAPTIEVLRDAADAAAMPAGGATTGYGGTARPDGSIDTWLWGVAAGVLLAAVAGTAVWRRRGRFQTAPEVRRI